MLRKSDIRDNFHNQPGKNLLCPKIFSYHVSLDNYEATRIFKQKRSQSKLKNNCSRNKVFYLFNGSKSFCQWPKISQNYLYASPYY